MSDNLTPDDKREINQKLREVGAEHQIHMQPFSPADLQLMLLVDADGQVTTGGMLPVEQLPTALRTVADSFESQLALGLYPQSCAPKSGLL